MTKKRKRYGMTLIEFLIAVTASFIVLLTTGVLLVGGHKAENDIYQQAHKKIKTDAQTTMLTFGQIGRKSNRSSYHLYTKSSGRFYPAVPQTANPQENISGDAVELRYWDVPLDKNDSHNLLDSSKLATAYAFFYIDDEKNLKVDYGSYPPGAVINNSRNTNNITTYSLAENVTPDPNSGAFSHTALNGVGFGSVRMDITISDPCDSESINVKTSVMLRNVWPGR